MNFLLVARSLGIGGAERQITVLARGLAARGHAVTVGVFYEGGRHVAALQGAGIGVVCLGKAGRWDLVGFRRRLHRLIRDTEPSAVYSFLTTPNVATALALPAAGRPRLVWGCRASNMQIGRYGFFARATSVAERVLSSRPDAIVCNSRAGRCVLERRNFPRSRLSVVWNGIDSEVFFPDTSSRTALRNAWGFGDDTPVVGVVGRLDPMKDHHTFLRAAADLLRRRHDVRFVLVGSGPLHMRLRGQATALGLDDTVLWLGEQAEMREIYCALDLLCLPSAWGEGFPNVVGEAMACGVPAVVTDVGDSAVIVGDLGTVVPPGNPARMAAALVEMVDRIESGAAPPAHALREHTVSNFGVDRMVTATEVVLAGS